MCLVSSKQDRSLHAQAELDWSFWCSKFTWIAIKRYWDFRRIWVDYVISLSWKRESWEEQQGSILTFKKWNFFSCSFKCWFWFEKWPSLLFLFFFLIFFKLWKAVNNLKPECLMLRLWKKIKEEKKHSPLGGDPNQKVFSIFPFSHWNEKPIICTATLLKGLSSMCTAGNFFFLPAKGGVCLQVQ